MKNTVPILLTALLCLLVACEPSPSKPHTAEAPAKQPTVAADTLPTNFVKPEPKGGVEALMKVFTSNLIYPQQAVDQSVEDKIFCKLTIDTLGTVVKKEIIKGIGHGCDQEVLRVVDLLPQWTPASQNGRLVKATVVVSISFKLDGSGTISSPLMGAPGPFSVPG